jgi:hypothetical protein
MVLRFHVVLRCMWSCVFKCHMGVVGPGCMWSCGPAGRVPDVVLRRAACGPAFSWHLVWLHVVLRFLVVLYVVLLHVVLRFLGIWFFFVLPPFHPPFGPTLTPNHCPLNSNTPYSMESRSWQDERLSCTHQPPFPESKSHLRLSPRRKRKKPFFFLRPLSIVCYERWGNVLIVRQGCDEIKHPRHIRIILGLH